MRRQQPQQPPQEVLTEEGSLPHIVGLQASTPLSGSLPVGALCRGVSGCLTALFTPRCRIRRRE
jgi:hypothetical protein